MYKLRLSSIMFLLFTVACGRQTQSSQPPLSMGVTTNLSSYRTTIYSCSTEINQSVRVDVLPLETLLSGKYDAILQVGEPKPDRVLPVQIGQVRLTFIINPQNPITQIKASQLTEILLGMVDNWQEVAPTVFSTSTTINLWSYPVGDDVRGMVETILLEDRQITPQSYIAPDDKAMMEAVNNDPAAIGFLLELHPQTDIRSLQIDPPTVVAQALPVIASFTTIPEGDLKNLIICLSKQGE